MFYLWDQAKRWAERVERRLAALLTHAQATRDQGGQIMAAIEVLTDKVTALEEKVSVQGNVINEAVGTLAELKAILEGNASNEEKLGALADRINRATETIDEQTRGLKAGEDAADPSPDAPPEPV